MTKRKKRLLIFGILVLFSGIILALGLKYFPFTKIIRMPSAQEKEFVNPQKMQDQSPHSLYYDFEIPPGKEMPGGFYKGIGHSGQYSVKAFGQNSFSIAVERTAGEIGVENLKAVALSAWVYVFPTKKEVKGHLVFTASNEVGVNVCWQGVSVVEPEVPKGKWFKISKYFDLTTVAFKPGYKIQVYFWNNSSTEILVDDYFIAFGGPVDRRGDSARVDMTRPDGYVPKFNYPPFPVSFLDREPLAKSINPAEIGPDDRVIAGNFLNTGTDALFVIRKEGRPGVYAFYPDIREFRKVTVSGSPNFTLPGSIRSLAKGRFLASSAEQILIHGEKGWMLCSLTGAVDICKSTDSKPTELKLLSTTVSRAAGLACGDFNGDGRCETVNVSEDGSWKLSSFEPAGTGGTWKVIAEGAAGQVREWTHSTLEFSLQAGSFFPGLAHDVLLTVWKNREDNTVGYSLRKLNFTAGRWEALTGKGDTPTGRTIGLDTLKPADQFFITGSGGGKTIFRYNRDWRYDLKEIRFNDSTFAIVSAIDFHGYEKDHNPKYYESLCLAPGNFLKQPAPGFAVIGHVAASRNYRSVLPDFSDLYTFPVKK